MPAVEVDATNGDPYRLTIIYIQGILQPLSQSLIVVHPFRGSSSFDLLPTCTHTL